MQPEGVEFYEVQPLPRLIVGLGRTIASAATVMILVWIAVHAIRGELVFALATGVLFALFLILGLVLNRICSHPRGLETTLTGGVLRLVWRCWQSHPAPRTISVREITSLDVVNFAPVVDGEWGSREGKAIRIILRDGDEVRLGTARPDELLAALGAARGRGEANESAGTSG